MEEINVADMLKETLTAADDHMKVAREKLFQAQNILEMLRAGDGNFVVTTVTKEATVAMADDENKEQQFFAFWTGIVLIVTSLAIVGFLRRSFISEYLGKMENCFRAVYAKLGEILLTNHKLAHAKNKIKASIAGFVSFNSEYLHKMKNCFRSAHAKLGEIIEIILKYWPQKPKPKINKEYVKNEIKVTIENFQSMKERLKLMKSQKINTRDVKDIKAAIETVRSIEENLKKMKSQNINEEEVKEMEGAIQPAIKAVESMENIVNKGVWLLPQF